MDTLVATFLTATSLPGDWTTGAGVMEEDVEVVVVAGGLFAGGLLAGDLF